MKRSALSALTAVSLALFTVSLPAAAQEAYPDRPISVASCYPAGGGVDRNLRIVERVAANHLSQPLLPQYRTGGSGSAAMMYIKDADPSGYELAMCDNGGAIIAPIAQGLDFSADDVRPIAQISFVPWILTVRAGSPYQSVEDLVKAAKESADPIAVEVSDLASSDHYAWLLFLKAAGLAPSDFRWKPHGGGGPKMRAILANEGDLLLEDAGEIASHVKAGTLRPLAVMSENRIPEFPNVPTLKELNYDVVAGSSVVLYAPGRTPDDRVAVLHEALSKVKADPLLAESFQKVAQDVNSFIVSDEFEADWRKQFALAKELLAEALGR
jgi:putative tricarboxylic transport membrane protein